MLRAYRNSAMQMPSIVPQARERLKLPIAQRCRAGIEREIQQHGDILPPWKRYPDLDRYSIGWRMGYGESYLDLWWEWTTPFEREQLVAYFRRYAPFPKDWLDWIAYELGMEESYGLGLTLEEQEAVKRWLAEQGLSDRTTRRPGSILRRWRPFGG